MKIALLSFCLLLFSFAITSCDQTEDPPIIDDPTNPSDNDNDDNLFDFIVKYINSQEEEPISLKLKIDLGFMPNAESNWRIILKAIETAQKFVALDLSECTMDMHSKKNFDPYVEIKSGEDKIVSLILPVVAADISGHFERDKITFNHFSNLEYIKGEKIEHIGAGAFYDCVKLKKAEFPIVNDIMQSAFRGCENLLEANFPFLMILDKNVFSGCVALETVNFPELEFILDDTFNNCTSLKTVTIPKAKYIGQRAFYNCSSLTKADFPLVETLGNEAFRNCVKLETVIFQKIKIIYARSFFNCVSLINIDFSSAVHIADHAFYNCTSLVEVVFPKVMIVEPMSFANCTSLTTARFYADPMRTSEDHPRKDWLKWYEEDGQVGLPKKIVSEDSIYIHNDTFKGCISLSTLDIRNAWNVFFAVNSLADIGTHLDIYLYDDIGIPDEKNKRSYGHPQTEWFLGGQAGGIRTVYSIKFILPFVGNENESQIKKAISPGRHGIWIQLGDKNQYDIVAEIERLP